MPLSSLRLCWRRIAPVLFSPFSGRRRTETVTGLQVPPTEALVTLERFAYTPMGTFGLLSVDGGVPFRTVERPWARNMDGISCIPCGAYSLKLGMFYSGDGVGGKKDYPAYEILDVP